MNLPAITFDAPTRKALRAAHLTAKAENLETFAFRGQTFHTKYAQYLLEHLDTLHQELPK